MYKTQSFCTNGGDYLLDESTSESLLRRRYFFTKNIPFDIISNDISLQALAQDG